MQKHLVLYDGTCGLCDGVVQFLLKADKSKKFVFAPLQGKTAEKYATGVDSVALVEDYQGDSQVYVMSKGVFRILWLLGGGWKVIGSLGFLPPWLFDWAYRIVARNRYKWVAQRCLVPRGEDKKRFLP